MTIVNFTPLPSLLGGVLIGIASITLLYFNGKISGISGITKGIFKFQKNDLLWRILFFLGLLLGGAISINAFDISAKEIQSTEIDPRLIIAAILVGIGTAYGNGCTSGHGICGLSRKSQRSIVATLVFMTIGIITVYIDKLL